MLTVDFIKAIREDLKRELREEILAEIAPQINKMLYDNIFTLKEAALYRKVSEKTLRRMIAAGEIPYFKQRGQYFFRQRDLDSDIAKRLKSS